MPSTTPSDDSAVPCEWDGCDRAFDTLNGMKLHHVQAHDESISGAEVECSWCGDSKNVVPAKAKAQDRHFCDNECSGNWRSENVVGENHPNWNGGKTTVECAYCGESKEVTPAIATGRERHFCGWDCRGPWQSEHWSDENNPNSNRRTVECAQCGVSKSVPQSVVENREHHYCSRECYAEWLSENKTGKDHPSYAGGHAWNYGPNWRRQRRRTLARDDEQCVECGMTRDEHFEAYGDDIDVHHKRPLATFPFVDEDYNRDWEVVNALSNLVTCCTGCHGRLDQESRENYPRDEYPRYIESSEPAGELTQAELVEFA